MYIQAVFWCVVSFVGSILDLIYMADFTSGMSTVGVMGAILSFGMGAAMKSTGD
jgi:hypothetical protein